MGSRQPQPVTGYTSGGNINEAPVSGPTPWGSPSPAPVSPPQFGSMPQGNPFPSGFNPASAPQTMNMNQPPVPPAGGGFFNSFPQPGPAGGRCPTCGK